jgi:DnaJ like chaperone protein
MSWLGKMIGGAFGFLMGGPLGAVLGTALGHQYDASEPGAGQGDPRLGNDDPQRTQMAFFTATFSVMGHLAKADGQVSKAEIDAARAVMQRLELSEDLRRMAIQLFTDGKKPGFPLHQALEQLRAECYRRPALLRLFIEILLETAYADGPLRPGEERLLLQICDRIHLSRFDFYAMKARLDADLRLAYSSYGRARHRAPRAPRTPPIETAYATLGLRPSATGDEIKRAYRRLMGQHHPDRLAANGLSDDMVRVATEKTQQIRKAYELIAETRKL